MSAGDEEIAYRRDWPEAARQPRSGRAKVARLKAECDRLRSELNAARSAAREAVRLAAARDAALDSVSRRLVAHGNSTGASLFLGWFDGQPVFRQILKAEDAPGVLRSSLKDVLHDG